MLSRLCDAQKSNYFLVLLSDARFIIDRLCAPWGVARQSHLGDISTCFMSTDFAASLTRPTRANRWVTFENVVSRACACQGPSGPARLITISFYYLPRMNGMY